MASLISFQHVFEKAAQAAGAPDTTVITEAAQPQTRSSSKGKEKDPDKLDYAVSKGIQTLKSRIQMQEIEKANKAIKANKTYKKRGDANTTLQEAQEEEVVMSNRDKLIRKKWTSLDRCLQWQMLKTFVESQPNGQYDLQKLHLLLKQNAIPAHAVTYDHKEARITELRITP